MKKGSGLFLRVSMYWFTGKFAELNQLFWVCNEARWNSWRLLQIYCHMHKAFHNIKHLANQHYLTYLIWILASSDCWNWTALQNTRTLKPKWISQQFICFAWNIKEEPSRTTRLPIDGTRGTFAHFVEWVRSIEWNSWVCSSELNSRVRPSPSLKLGFPSLFLGVKFPSSFQIVKFPSLLQRVKFQSLL